MPLDSPTYPVALVLEGRRCLVVGGGQVARRKVEGLLDARADVTVVAPEIVEELAALDVRLERRRYRLGEAADYWMVVTATGVPEIDRAVFADGDSAGVLVNAADDIPGCSFVLPAVLRHGPVTVAVSTQGTSPALAGWIRDKVADVVTEDIAILAELVGSARTTIRGSGRSSEGLAWRTLIDGPLPDLVATAQFDEARQLVDQWVRDQLLTDTTDPVGAQEVVTPGVVAPEAIAREE